MLDHWYKLSLQSSRADRDIRGWWSRSCSKARVADIESMEEQAWADSWMQSNQQLKIIKEIERPKIS